MNPSKEQNRQEPGHHMQCQKFPFIVSFDMLPEWLQEITYEIRTCRHKGRGGLGETLVCFKPITGDQIIRAEAAGIEITKKHQRKAIAGGTNEQI